MKKALSAAAVLLGVILAAGGCATYDNFMTDIGKSGQEDEAAVRIGVFEPMSGKDAAFGALEISGIELAHGIYPEVLGKPVELVFEDNRSDPDYSEVAAEKLIKKKVSVVLGSYGCSNSLIGGALFEQAGIPAIGITCANPLVTSINEYYFRVCFIDSFQAIAMAKHAIEHDQALTAAIMEESGNDYAKTLAQVFEEKFIEMTGNAGAIVSITTYKKNDENYQSQLNAIRAAAPDVIFLPGSPEAAGRIMKEARGSGITAEFLGISDWEDEILLETAGHAAEGATFAALFDPEVILSTETAIFLEAYAKEHGSDAVPTRAEALGYDAYLAAIRAIEATGVASPGYRIRTALSQLKQMPGVTGEITFDANGDAIKPVVIKAVQNGGFAYINTAIPAWE